MDCKKCPRCGSQNVQIQKNVLLYLYDKPTTVEQVVICLECGYISQVIGHNKAELIFTIIKEIDVYKERLEPAWEYPNPDDQWLFAETIKEYVGAEYDVLYVYDDNTYAVVSDSGTLPEESSFFTSVGHPFPAVCIRTSTERPEALDKACFILAGIDEHSLLQAVTTAVDMNDSGDYGIPVPNYVEENVSTKVVKIIQSYTGVVDKMVWRK